MRRLRIKCQLKHSTLLTCGSLVQMGRGEFHQGAWFLRRRYCVRGLERENDSHGIMV
jgi:hypothetical protein